MHTHLILMDVDGTMIKNHLAVREQFIGALEDVSGQKRKSQTSGVEFAGMTDRGIVRAILESVGRGADFDDFFPKFEARFRDRLASVYNDHPDPMLLPGVIELLDELGQRDHVALALGTGNCRSTCEVKLQRFGLWDRFGAGGFGGEHEIRSDALKAGVEEARDRLGWEDGTVWVVGDTVRDVAAAREMSAKVLAVATGPDSLEELRASAPDALVEDLSDTVAIIEALGV